MAIIDINPIEADQFLRRKNPMYNSSSLKNSPRPENINTKLSVASVNKEILSIKLEIVI
jgi:hypothetical protein